MLPKTTTITTPTTTLFFVCRSWIALLINIPDFRL